MSERADDLRERMACLADESRFRLVRILVDSERCVSELARLVGLSQSCTTRHLQALSRLGLVRGVRRGRQVVFSLRVDAPGIGWVLEQGALATPQAAPRDPEPHTGPVAIEVQHREVDDRPETDGVVVDPVTRRSGDLEDYLL